MRTWKYLEADLGVVDGNVLGEEIGADGGLVLVGELLVDVLANNGSLTNAGRK